MSVVLHELSARYRGFISYSHAADHRLAPALQSGLQRFAKPWYRLRAMRVFRDATGLAVTPELWGSIERALSDSEYFILLASPEAAQSKWVEQEVGWWLTNRNVSHLLIVLTEGELAWDAGAGDFDWTKTTALPRRIEKSCKEEPNYLDLRAIRSSLQLSLREPRFLEAVARLSATLQSRPLDELIGEDLRQHRRTMGLLRLSVVGLGLFAIVAGVAGYLSIQARRETGRIVSDREHTVAAARHDAASREVADRALAALATDRELATLLAVEALKIAPTFEAESALRQSLSTNLTPETTLAAHRGGVYVIEYLADGRLMTGGGDHVARIWDLATGKPSLELRGHTDGVTGVDVTPDGKRILTVSAYDHSARLWDAASGRSLFTISDEKLESAQLSPDGRYVLTVSNMDDVSLWDGATGARARRIGQGWSEVTTVAFSPDGARLVVVDRYPKVCDVATGKILFELDGHRKEVNDAGYSADGRRIVTASGDGTARVWRASNGQAAAVLQHESGVTFALFTSDSRRLLTGDADRVLRLWDPESGRTVTTIDFRPSELSNVEVSRNGTLLVATFENDTDRVIDVASGKTAAELAGRDQIVRAVAFSPDNRHLALAYLDGRVLVYSLQVGGAVDQLLAIAAGRVKRVLTADERARYLPTAVVGEE